MQEGTPKFLAHHGNPSTLYPYTEELAKRDDMKPYWGEPPKQAQNKTTYSYVLAIKKSVLLSCLAKRGDISPRELEAAISSYRKTLKGNPTIDQINQAVEGDVVVSEDKDEVLEKLGVRRGRNRRN